MADHCCLLTIAEYVLLGSWLDQLRLSTQPAARPVAYLLSSCNLMPALCAQKQDKQGKTVECKAPNAPEIQKFIEDVHEKLDSLTITPGQLETFKRPIPSGWRAEWSLDNAAVHKKAYEDPAWEKKPKNASFGQVQPPPYSPDMHKVIEHVHGTLCSAFRVWLEANHKEAAEMDIPTLFKQLEKLFYQHITVQSVRKDLQSLAKTFSQVKELNGAYPAAKYR